MNTKHALFGAALLAAAAASPAFAQRSTAITAPPARYSLLGGTTVPNGVDVVSVEAGWPSISFGFTHGTSSNTDIGFKFDLIYGFEYTDVGQFGIGARVPLRMSVWRRDRLTALVHVDPGLKLYTTDIDTTFGVQFPVGVTVGYTVDPQLAIAFGVELPMFLAFTSPHAPGQSQVDFFLGPLFGPAVEYHVDRNLTVGLNTRFGPMFATRGGSQFGFITQLLVAYRL
jgi:hypothetical protein